MTDKRGRRLDAAVMDAFWDRRGTGVSVAEAARAVGIDGATGRRAVQISGGIRPRRPVVASGRFLSVQEREQIALGWAAGCSKADLARWLGRHPATIGRELTRNQTLSRRLVPVMRDGLSYVASTAQNKAEARALRPKPAKLRDDVELRAFVQDGLLVKWSPRQIQATLKVEFPDRPEMRVSHETIYQSLYVQSRGALRRELTACLRTGRAIRRPKRCAEERRGRIKDMVMISERPAEVEDRAVPGHWEGDLIIGKGTQSAIGTLVERATRYVMLLHLPDGHGAAQVQHAMVAQMSRLPKHLRASLTWDQGSEMANHAQIKIDLEGMPIYFCDPHSPWQRGSNENTNGLLRQYFPKATDLSVHTPEDLEFVAAELNARPRETLTWHTPAQRLNQLLLR